MDDIVAARRSGDTCGSAVGCAAAAAAAAAAATAASTSWRPLRPVTVVAAAFFRMQHLYISGRLLVKLHDISCDATGFR